MPYEKEFANHITNQKVLKEDSFIEDLKSLGLRLKQLNYDRLDIFSNMAQSSKIEQVFVFDGSKYNYNISDNYDADLCIINLNQSKISIEKLLKFNSEEFSNPNLYNDLYESDNSCVLIPVSGFNSVDYQEDIDFFRYFLYQNLKKIKNPFIKNEKESIFQTYIYLLNNSQNSVLNIQPCVDCLSNNHFVSKNKFKNLEKIKCSCNEKDIFITDFLGFHERFSEDGKNDSLTTQIMLVLEKLLAINLIRNLYLNNELDVLKHSVFLIDGPLAIYSTASWLSNSIADFLYEVNEKVDVILIGVEKDGQFVDHIKKVNKFFNDKEQDLKKSYYSFFNNDYIKKYIKMYDSNNYYGENTNFGKKLFYKNKYNQLFIINLAFFSKEDKQNLLNSRNTEEYVEKINKLGDVLWLFDTFSSSSYKNALSFLSIANKNVALSQSKISKEIIDNMLKKMISSSN